MNERDSTMRDVAIAAADNREDADRYKSRIAELEEQVEAHRQFHHSTLDERDHLKELLETLAQAVVDWWPNSNPPSQINSVLRAIRVRYPHMAKPR